MIAAGKIGLPTIVHAEFIVDWLNFTALRNVRASYISMAMDDRSGQQYIAKPVHGYSDAQENELGARVMWSTKREDMGVHIMYAGSTLNRYAKHGISARDILRHHAIFGDVCKRIDLAIDVMDSPIDITKLYKQLVDSVAKTALRTFNLITGTTGDTLYLGSRQSEQFLRIYDKAAQKKTDDNWKRIELEMKGSRAIAVAREFAVNTDEGIVAMARKLLAGMVQFNDATWKEVVGDLAMRIGKAKDDEPDTVGWLLGQVAPAMARYINQSGDDKILEKFLMTIDALTDKSLSYD